jgi:hypothetical protein
VCGKGQEAAAMTAAARRDPGRRALEARPGRCTGQSERGHPGAEPERETIELGRDDLLFFYSDGVTEARSPDMEYFED